MPSLLRQRFAQIAPAFDLDGPGARFLQDTDVLEGAEVKAVSTLLIDTPGKNTLSNNADLFVKRGGAPVMSRAAAAMALYTLSAYAPTGGAGHRTSLRGGGPLTTLVVASHRQYGDTLWGRLWPNVETSEHIAARTTEAVAPDDLAMIFPWLLATRISNTKDGGRSTTPADVHPLQVYWGMPRRIRMLFEEAQDRLCGVTGTRDKVVVTGYRTRNYGTNYSEGFQHPLTPYYRQRAGTTSLPVHPQPGGISYRHWPGLVVRSRDGLREPAQVVRDVPQKHAMSGAVRFASFGFDMDNMKARSWVESEMSLWLLDSAVARDMLERYVQHATAGADKVTWLLVRAVKSALYDRPSDAAGDYGFIAERFYRVTEGEFYLVLGSAARLIDEQADEDDPTVQARVKWAHCLASAALRLFDEYAPSDALEGTNMHRHVKARFFLHLAVTGRGEPGKSLYGELGIVSPDAARARKLTQEAT
ncbi:MAG: type I-E CRISPR-associated protein Cse1/CasA [Spirochaetaceae bacterium]|nr:type I-E CRISPR-associated protein Cse1/CasA [Spirochaetaceae bacterium]